MTGYVALRAVNVGGANRVPMAYPSYLDGSGRSRLRLDYLGRQPGVTGTARNRRTVQRLATLLETTEP